MSQRLIAIVNRVGVGLAFAAVVSVVAVLGFSPQERPSRDGDRRSVVTHPTGTAATEVAPQTEPPTVAIEDAELVVLFEKLIQQTVAKPRVRARIRYENKLDAATVWWAIVKDPQAYKIKRHFDVEDGRWVFSLSGRFEGFHKYGIERPVLAEAWIDQGDDILHFKRLHVDGKRVFLIQWPSEIKAEDDILDALHGPGTGARTRAELWAKGLE